MMIGKDVPLGNFEVDLYNITNSIQLYTTNFSRKSDPLNFSQQIFLKIANYGSNLRKFWQINPFINIKFCSL